MVRHATKGLVYVGSKSRKQANDIGKLAYRTTIEGVEMVRLDPAAQRLPITEVRARVRWHKELQKQANDPG